MQGIDVKDTRDGFTITYRRASLLHLVLFLWILFVLVVRGYSIFLFFLSVPQTFTSISIFLIVSFLLIVIIYSSITEFFNKTEVIVRSNSIQILNKPFPDFFKNKIFHKKEIKKIYNTSESIFKSYKDISYDLIIITKADKKYIIIPNIRNFEKVRYIELKLKIHLGLEEI